MIKNYNEFINESLELLLESNVIFSEKFKSVLRKINSRLSKQILDIENLDLPVRSNYVDITKNNDKVSFIPDARAQDMITKNKPKPRFNGGSGGWLKHKDTNNSMFTSLGYTPEGEPYQPRQGELGEEISRIASNTSGNLYVYVKFENGKGVYNINKLSYDDTVSKKLWGEFRQEIKIGRIIRALSQASNIEFTTKEIEEFVNLFKATIDKINDKFSFFEIVTGEMIGHWYNIRNYYTRRGNLGSSCMSNVNDNYFNIYVRNPEVCSLVILKSSEDETKIIGRALLWTLSDGKKFMDRVYTANDSDYQLFKSYAAESGWYIKRSNNSWTEEYIIPPDGSSGIKQILEVNVKKGRYTNYPYLDTLKYFDPINGTLSTKPSQYLLESTCGGIICPVCNGDGYNEDDYDDEYDDNTCDECDGDGQIYY